MKYTSSIFWTCFWKSFIWEVKKFQYSKTSDSEVLVIHFLIQKYTWSYAFLIYVFVFWLGDILEVDFQNLFIVKLLRSILEVDFLNLNIYIFTQKYTWIILSKLIYFFSKSELVRNIFSKLMSFLKKLRSILEVDLQHWCIFFQTLKYTRSRLLKLVYLCSNLEVYRK